MRAVFGLLLVMVGLAMAVTWVPERDSQRQLAVVTDIAVQGLPRIVDVQPGSGRTFSPQTPLLASVEPQSARPQHTVATARVMTPSAEVPHQGSGPSVVTGSIATVPQMSSTLAVRAHQHEMPRDELVRSLQRELKRVGCYAGEVDGDWGSGSKRAMTTFTDRVNASLPVEQPDFILLTLLKGQPAGVCGKTCPSGQSVADNGRCMPAGMVAQQARRRGREDVAATVPAPAVAPGWNTQVVRAQPTQTREQVQLSAATSGTATPDVRAGTVAPLPGRMGMGLPPSAVESAVPAENAARNAIRSAQGEMQEAKPGKRDRSRRAARRSGPRYDAPLYVYRASPPNYYAYAPRRSGRSWTATFFSGGF